MDDREFKRRLSEVADWHIPKTDREIGSHIKRRRTKARDERLDPDHDGEIQPIFSGDTNPTYAPMLTRVHIQACECPDCGKICEHGRHVEYLLQERYGKRAWRSKCLTCKKYQDPFTGKYNLTGSTASTKFSDYVKKQTTEETRRVELSDRTVLENGGEKITIYK